MINQIFQAPDLLNDSSKYQISVWWNVLQANKSLGYNDRVNLYERSLKCLPYCYKIWVNYIKEMQTYILDASIISNKYKRVNQIFENCLIFLHKMPKIWIFYVQFLEKQEQVTLTRQVYDRALKALPVTQHEMIWSPYIEWTFKQKVPDTVKTIINRFTKINPDIKERYVDYLILNNEINEACFVLQQIIDDQRFISFSGNSKYMFLMQLCKLISENPDKITSIDCEAVIRHGIKKYTDETGNLWIFLSDYFIKQGNFEKARDVFEEGLESVLTARDFGLIYNGYINFEEEMINLIQYDEEVEEQVQENYELEKQLNELLNLSSQPIVQEEQQDELSYRLRRLEKLLDRRPVLLSNCILRQNKNNIAEWLNRFQIFKNDQTQLLRCFGEALTQINHQKAINGLFSEIWFQNYNLGFKWLNSTFSLMIQKMRIQLCTKQQRYNYLKKVNFKTQDDHVNIWCFWVEFLIQNQYYQDALLVCKQSIFKRSQKNQTELIHNLKLWSLYLDLEINLGTQNSIKQAFYKCIELKVASPFIFMHFADYLENLKFYEESFKIYEIALDTFSWPVLYEIWILYLSKFVQRYEGTRLERARDLFETVLSTVSDKQSKIYYLIYADFEEKYGLINHVIEIYDKMCQSEENQLENYNIYIAKVSQFLGITKTRAIFQKAIEILKKYDKIDMGLRFSILERKLGEIDRARAIYKHISQFANPDDDIKFLWKTWEEFEIKHGNVDTYKDYMRYKRTVQQNYFMGAPDLDRIRDRVIEEQIVN